MEFFLPSVSVFFICSEKVFLYISSVKVTPIDRTIVFYWPYHHGALFTEVDKGIKEIQSSWLEVSTSEYVFSCQINGMWTLSSGSKQQKKRKER